MTDIDVKSSELAVFDEVAATIAEYKTENEKIVFDYESKEGAKQAKSHIAKLRKVKGKIAEVHKAAKAEALAFGRKLDAKKNEYTGEVDKMIKVHKDPLDAIETEKTAEALRKQHEYAEREAKRIAEIEARERAIILAEEKIAREKAEQEEKIRREKAAEAERVMKEQQEKIARIEEEKRIAEEKVERARIEAEAKAKAEAESEEERLAEIAAEKAIEAKRIADKTHRKQIEDEIHAGLMRTGYLGNVEASKILEAIKEAKIPHLIINY